MAGMFYSLEEAAEKLGLAQEDVKQLAAEGKLREFRDGASIMFKVDEVEALLGGSDTDGQEEVSLASEGATDMDDVDELLDLASLDEGLEAGDGASDIQLESLDETGTTEDTSDAEALQPVDEGSADTDISDDILLESLDETGTSEADSEEEAPLTLEPETIDASEALDEDLDALLGFAEEDDQSTPEPVPETVDSVDDLSLVEPDLETGDIAETPEIDLADDTQLVPEASADTNTDTNKEMDDSILLALDATDAGGSDLTNMDTALAGEEGINVLGETDSDFKLTDDTMAETLAGLGASGETSLEEIEDDMNLDSFGSGSGLLDLSLQADDTSLGGILDEIYTTEDDDAGGTGDNVGTTEEVVAESETLPVESGMEVEDEYVPAVMPMASLSATAEVPADASSRMLGGLLFIPIFVLLFTSVIAISGMMGNTPSALSSIQSFIWYVLGGLVMLALILSVMGLTRGDGSAKPARAKKARREKSPKKAKAKKETAPKAQAPKTKKGKKPLFAKKKK